MGRKCKCQICEKILDSDKAYKVTRGKRNLYYCDEIEYEIYISQKQEESDNKDFLYEGICEILGYKSKNSLIFKEMNNLHESYLYKYINEVLQEKKDSISQLIEENGIEKEFNKIRYIFAAISRDIHDYVAEQKKIQKQKEIDELRKIEVKKDELEKDKFIEEIKFKSKGTTDFSDFF
ncbi:hypothetical protein FKF97_10680 [Clostridium perfringens]|nr:hypothetical protein [Clostridium perfringens]